VDTQARGAALAVALDVDNNVSLASDKAATGTAVIEPSGASVSGTEGTLALTKGLRFLSIIAWVQWIPGVNGLLTRRLFPQVDVVPPPSTPKPPTPTVVAK
jgi:hypothetical protein